MQRERSTAFTIASCT